jgi:hypothetical protein
MLLVIELMKLMVNPLEVLHLMKLWIREKKRFWRREGKNK